MPIKPGNLIYLVDLEETFLLLSARDLSPWCYEYSLLDLDGENRNFRSVWSPKELIRTGAVKIFNGSKI